MTKDNTKLEVGGIPVASIWEYKIDSDDDVLLSVELENGSEVCITLTLKDIIELSVKSGKYELLPPNWTRS